MMRKKFFFLQITQGPGLNGAWETPIIVLVLSDDYRKAAFVTVDGRSPAYLEFRVAKGTISMGIE